MSDFTQCREFSDRVIFLRKSTYPYNSNPSFREQPADPLCQLTQGWQGQRNSQTVLILTFHLLFIMAIQNTIISENQKTAEKESTYINFKIPYLTKNPVIAIPTSKSAPQAKVIFLALLEFIAHTHSQNILQLAMFQVQLHM